MRHKLKYQLAFTAAGAASGAVSAIVAGNMCSAYAGLSLPSFAPGAAVFPAVWSVIYVLRGAGAGAVFGSFSPYRERALAFFAVQLAAEFMWPVIFFGARKYLAAFFWLLLVLYSALLMTQSLAKANKKAAAMQLPYLIWLVYSAALNLFAALMN